MLEPGHYNFNAIDGSGTGDGMIGSITGGPWTSDGNLEFTYDNLGRALTQRVQTYDNDTENWMQWNYDSLGRIDSYNTKLGSGGLFDYTYVSTSSPLADFVTHPNNSGSTQIKADYDYQLVAGGRFLKQIKNTVGTATTVSQFDYTHSTGGQILNWVRKVNGITNTYTHAYDDAYRLTSRAGGTALNYAYDPANNVDTINEGTSRTMLQDTRNRLISSTAGGQTDNYTYDANGNITQISNAYGGKRMVYTWDDINRLIKIQSDANSNSAFENGDKQTEFSYDGLSRRYKAIESTHNGTSWAVQRTDYFVWAGNQIVQKRVGSAGASAVKSNYYPLGESRHIGTARTATDYYYTLDHLGSIREMLNTTGTITSLLRIHSLRKAHQGCRRSGRGFRIHWPLGSCRERADLAKYRAYDSRLGRWLNEDPADAAEALPEGPNLFSYCGNDALNETDPLGLNSGFFKEVSKRALKLSLKLVRNCMKKCRGECATCCAKAAPVMALSSTLIKAASVSVMSGWHRLENTGRRNVLRGQHRSNSRYSKGLRKIV